jgi:hypothetical protein
MPPLPASPVVVGAVLPRFFRRVADRIAGPALPPVVLIIPGVLVGPPLVSSSFASSLSALVIRRVTHRDPVEARARIRSPNVSIVARIADSASGCPRNEMSGLLGSYRSSTLPPILITEVIEVQRALPVAEVGRAFPVTELDRFLIVTEVRFRLRRLLHALRRPFLRHASAIPACHRNIHRSQGHLSTDGPRVMTHKEAVASKRTFSLPSARTAG